MNNSPYNDNTLSYKIYIYNLYSSECRRERTTFYSEEVAFQIFVIAPESKFVRFFTSVPNAIVIGGSGFIILF